MRLKEGRYNIRFVPPGICPPFVGGLYVTSTDIGQPIQAEAVNSGHPPQVWEVRISDNSKYYLIQPDVAHKLIKMAPISVGWTLSNPSDCHPGGNILFGANFTEFEIEPVGSGDNMMYSIKVVNTNGPQSSHVTFYVTEKEHHVVSRAYWDSLSSKNPPPYWEFTPVKDDIRVADKITSYVGR